MINNNTAHKYFFIDWQNDFKNGYRYNGYEKSKKIKIDENGGKDIKIPWELARCQHLPFLAKVFCQTREEIYLQEVHNEILDFIAFNPVGYGVNWKCTMDVAIRVCNWIMSINICMTADENHNIDNEFLKVLKESIYYHALFIKYHLEDKQDYRGNHYFANIMGLLFSSAFLKKGMWVQWCLKFSVKEFFNSIDEQFYDDGGNFEASLPYHKLTLEMVLYGYWLITILNEDTKFKAFLKMYYEQNKKLIQHCNEKISNAMCLMKDVIKPNGEIYQLGDNDSGHFMKLEHYGQFLTKEEYIKKYENIYEHDEEMCWDENELCAKEILIIIRAATKHREIEESFLSSCFGNVFKQISCFDCKRLRNTENPKVKLSMPEYKFETVTEHKFPKGIDISKLVLIFYPQFGIYGYKSNEFYLGISAGGNGQNGKGGHAHNDKLSYELFVQGTQITRDPGSYVYTSSLDERNRFRSTKAHNTVYFGLEQNPIGVNCFELRQNTLCKLISVDNNRLIFSCQYNGYMHIRSFEIYKNRMIIIDRATEKFKTITEFPYYSNGYGKLIKKEVENEND